MQNLKQTVGLNWKNFQIDHLAFKIENLHSFLRIACQVGYSNIHKEKNLVSRGHVTRLSLF